MSKNKKIKVIKISDEEIEEFRKSQAEALRPIIKQQDRIRSISMAMAPYYAVPGRYVDPRYLLEQKREAEEELRRL